MLKTVSSVANALGALNYKGTWNASTNTPALASGVGTQGDYYVVSVDGATDLDGITNWGVGDWAAFNGSVWQRVEGGADGNFVNLDVTGTATLDDVTIEGQLTLNGAGSGNGLLKNINTGFGVGTERWIGADGTLSTWFYNVPTGGKHYIAVNNVNKLSVDGDDVNVLLGNLVIGTSGKGIDFSATSGTGTSELLDDYEEGVWTPAYTPTTGTFTTITAVATGRYTKVGRLVTLFGTMNTSGTLDVTGASGNLKITGLPFACNATIAGGGADISHQSWNLGTDILNTRMYVGTGSSEILMYENTMNGSSFPSGNITVADMSTSGASFANLITFTASYEV